MTDVQKIWNKVYESKILALWLMIFEDKKKDEMKKSQRSSEEVQ